MRMFALIVLTLAGLTACSQGLTDDESHPMVEEKLASAIAHGPQGPIGPQGEAGLQGVAGPLGARGAKGVEGVTQ